MNKEPSRKPRPGPSSPESGSNSRDPNVGKLHGSRLLRSMLRRLSDHWLRPLCRALYLPFLAPSLFIGGILLRALSLRLLTACVVIVFALETDILTVGFSDKPPT
ncbi:hypothetical protein IWX49DRAFT_563956 [Phyllosticta citricarpa]